MPTLPDKHTPLDLVEAEDALKQAFRNVFKSEPQPNQLRLLVAQSAFETGRWKSMHHFNFGNVKGEPDGPSDVTTFPCGEVIDGKEELFPAGDPHCFFRAFPDAVSGAENYVRTISHREDWKRGLMSGSPEVYNAALSRKAVGVFPYYTGNPVVYGRELRKLFEEFGGPKAGVGGPAVVPSPSLGSLPPVLPGSSPVGAELPVLRKGSSGPAVDLWHLLIIGKKHGIGAPLDEAATRAFQASRHLKPDQVVGPLTWKAAILLSREQT